MSLLFMKLKEKYTIKELENIFTRRIVFYMRKNNTPHFTTITQKIKAENLGYTIEDFKVDYEKYSSHKEIEIVYKILSSGISLTEYAKTRGFHKPNLLKALKNGIDYNNSTHLKYINEFIEVDTGNLEFKLYTGHVELYGSYEELELFKNKYCIEYNILFEKFIGKYHLAFDGWIFEKIKRGVPKKALSHT